MFQGKIKDKDINLLEAYKQKREPSKYEAVLKYSAPPIAIVLLFGSMFGFFKFREIMALREIDEINQQIAKIEAEQNADGQQEKYQELQLLNAEFQRLTMLYQNMNSYPELTQEIVNGIFQATGTSVEVRSISYVQESAILSLNLRTPYLSQTDAVIRRLKETGLFADVQYSGYTSSDIVESSLSSAQPNTTTNNQTPDISKMTDKELREYLAQMQNGQSQNTQNNKNGQTTTNKSTALGKAYDISVSCILKSVVSEE